MGVFAVYDTVGIQNYIFSSNKLAENVGASKLVADIFDKHLPEVISLATGQALSDWRKGRELNPELKAEIIYQGGGNAFVAFADEQTFQEVTKNFLIEVNQTAPGVGIAVAAIETDFGDTYKSDFDKLNKRLTLVKGGFNTPIFAGNQPITKQSARTGLPTSIFRDNEYLSENQSKKRKRYEKYRKDERQKLKEYAQHNEGDYSYIKDFSDLAFEKGSDSLIAIVHADGNNMGKDIKEYIERYESYAKAVPAIRELSKKIDECYAEARVRTIEAFKKAYAEYVSKLRKDFSSIYENKKLKNGEIIKNYDEPPYLELIGDGDDTTLIISGRFAIDFAMRLLREIENTPEDSRPFKDKKPTACAGVVLFHDHYPFSEAYKLVEQLCSSAKKPSRNVEGSYIDFHLHQSGSVYGLHTLRERQYMVDGQTILRRPWRASEELDDRLPNFSWIEKNVDKIKDMPRNKTKALRNAIGAGESAAEIAENMIRGEKLPELPKLPPDTDPDAIKVNKYAPYFDILEIYDTYENLLNKGDTKNA